MEKIVSLCKRRGFVFQSSEIYGGLNGCWDYGPLGVELKRNLKDFWWRRMTRERDDVVGFGRLDPDEPPGLAGQRPRGDVQRPDGRLSCSRKSVSARIRSSRRAAPFSISPALSLPASSWKVTKPYAVLLKLGDNVERARKVARQFYAQGGAAGAETELLLQGETTEQVESTRQYQSGKRRSAD